MFSSLYSIASWLSWRLLTPISWFNPKIRQLLRSRKQSQNLKVGKRKYWFHCASLGEFEMLRPILGQLLRQIGKDNVVITFFSQSGYDQVVKQEEYRDMVMYLPWDNVSQVKKFYENYTPEIAVFLRYELWYNLLKIGLEQEVKFYLVNGRFRPDHFVFKAWAKPYLKLLHKFKSLYCSDYRSLECLEQAGLTNAEFTGDTRYDRVLEISESLEEFSDLERFKGQEKLLVMGSSWAMEERMMAEIYHQLEGCKLLIAPHDVSEAHLLSIETEFAAYSPKRWSLSDFNDFDRVIIVDTIGILSGIYRYADISFIGGGFKGALHNITEAAVWGNYILFGPDTKKFPEAGDFIEAGFAKTVSNKRELLDTIRTFIESDLQKDIKDKAKAFVQSQAGASDLVFQRILTS